MKSSARKYCKNCYYPISDYAKFCSQCAQKNTDGKVPVFQFLKDFISNLFNLDSKLFLTFFALFIPGKLTIEYFKGRHKSFANPVRMFLFAGIGLFALVIAINADIDLDNNETSSIQDLERIKARGVIEDNLKRFQFEYLDTTDFHQTDSLFKWIKRDIKADPNRTDSVELLKFNSNDGMKISTEDFVNLTEDSILTKYNVEPGMKSMTVRQSLKIMKDGKGMFQFIMGKIPLLIFFMMPFLALILKVLYARKFNYYFVEHLVFSFHYHTFAFLAIILLVLMRDYAKGNGFIIAGVILSIFLYQYLAMKNVYKQGIFKTFFKFIILNFLYLILVVSFSILAGIIGFYLF